MQPTAAHTIYDILALSAGRYQLLRSRKQNGVSVFVTYNDTAYVIANAKAGEVTMFPLPGVPEELVEAI